MYVQFELSKEYSFYGIFFTLKASKQKKNVLCFYAWCNSSLSFSFCSYSPIKVFCLNFPLLTRKLTKPPFSSQPLTGENPRTMEEKDSAETLHILIFKYI